MRKSKFFIVAMSSNRNLNELFYDPLDLKQFCCHRPFQIRFWRSNDKVGRTQDVVNAPVSFIKWPLNAEKLTPVNSWVTSLLLSTLWTQQGLRIRWEANLKHTSWEAGSASSRQADRMTRFDWCKYFDEFQNAWSFTTKNLPHDWSKS